MTRLVAALTFCLTLLSPAAEDEEGARAGVGTPPRLWRQASAAREAVLASVACAR